jgi:hypothetical protein
MIEILFGAGMTNGKGSGGSPSPKDKVAVATNRHPEWQFESGGRKAAPRLIAGRRCSLRFAGEDEPVDQEQDHGSDDGHDPARLIRLVSRDQAAEPGSNERAGNAQEHRNNAPARISAGHQQLRNSPDDKADNQHPKDRVNAKIHMARESAD